MKRGEIEQPGRRKITVKTDRTCYECGAWIMPGQSCHCEYDGYHRRYYCLHHGEN
jgi:hypothetical protein